MHVMIIKELVRVLMKKGFVVMILKFVLSCVGNSKIELSFC